MASVALAILVVAVLTFPGEALDNNLLFSWLHEPLVAGDTQRNILVLRGLDASITVNSTARRRLLRSKRLYLSEIEI